MVDVVDFSSARPDQQLLLMYGITDVLFYVGNMPSDQYIQDCITSGIGITLIEETNVRPFEGGFTAGVARVRRAEGIADQHGYPPGARIAYAISDQNVFVPGSAEEEAQIRDHVGGIVSAASHPRMYYGNRFAVDVAKSVDPAALSWVPRTWGSDDTKDALIQEPNIASPVEETDANTRTIEFWGQWKDGFENAGPQPTGGEMLIRRTEAGPEGSNQPVGHTEMVSAWGYWHEPHFNDLPGAIPVNNNTWNSIHALVDQALVAVLASSQPGGASVPTHFEGVITGTVTGNLS